LLENQFRAVTTYEYHEATVRGAAEVVPLPVEFR
jgi:hypothetical protein